jgi:rhamnulokinase
MPASVRVAAVDLGASSGRVVLAAVGPDTLSLHPTARFPNEPVRLPSGLHWNLTELYLRTLDGLRTAVTQTTGSGGLASVGIDAWAVDYGLLAGHRLLSTPFHYRDPARCRRGPARVHALMTREELYRRNGLQFLPFNTLYQLADDPLVPQADSLLLLPDLVGFWLTGKSLTERTNASTTGLLSATTHEWDADLVQRLGLPRGLLGDLADPGTVLGGIAADIGASGVPVVTVGSHDTASAVVAVPMASPHAAYISCGTWGLVGVELDAPVITDAAREANFTNEGGVDRTVRFLTNVMGTWLLSETLRSWSAVGGQGSLPALLEAAAAEPLGPVFDVQDPRFLPPGDMPARITAWCAEHDVPVPASRPAIIRSIVESLAAAFAHAVDKASHLSGHRVDVIHVVGGGAQNILLCQAVANRSGRTVVAGPVEATAIGNVLVQARAAGAVGPRLADLRDLVRRTQPVVTLEPATVKGRLSS